MKMEYILSEEDNTKTVKHILKSKLKLSERLIKKLKYANRILCNSIPVHINTSVFIGDKIEADIDFDEINENIVPEKMELDIVYEDEYMIVLNKPPNMVVHPTSSHFKGTMANGLMYYFLEKGMKTGIRPVSRLDRDTSGIIVFAKNQFIQEQLIRLMHENSYYKEYAGIVCGNVSQNNGTINLPIDRKPDSIMLRHISENGASSVTHYKVIEQLNNATYMSFVLETGRTHQIRVHCQAIGHPILGDTLYPFLNDTALEQTAPFFPKPLIPRQALHSFRTVFKHPVNNFSLELVAQLPHDFTRALEILRN